MSKEFKKVANKGETRYILESDRGEIDWHLWFRRRPKMPGYYLMFNDAPLNKEPLDARKSFSLLTRMTQLNPKKYEGKLRVINVTRDQLEAASGGSTGASAVPSSGGKARHDSILVQDASKSQQPPGPRNMVARHANLAGRAGAHHTRDKDVATGKKIRGEKHKKDFRRIDADESHPGNFGFGSSADNTVLSTTNWQHSAEESVMSDLDADRKEKQYKGTQAYHATQRAKNQQRSADSKQGFDNMFGGADPLKNLKIKETGFNDDGHTSQENGMMTSALKSLYKHAAKLRHAVKHMGNDQSLEPWQQAKVTKAADYLDSVFNAVDDDQDLGEGYYDDDPNTFGGAHRQWAADQREHEKWRSHERNVGVEHEINNFQIVINGKNWKVFPGEHPADSAGEMRQLQRLQQMCARKSRESGKKWEVGITGAPATTESHVNEAPIEMNPDDPMDPTIYGHQYVSPSTLKTRMKRARSQLIDLMKMAETGTALDWERIAKHWPELSMNIEQIRHALDELATVRKKGGTRSRGIDKNIGEGELTRSVGGEKPFRRGAEEGVAEGLDQDLPSVLYHATYKPRLKSIKLKGLGAGGKRNWEDSQRGVVYLALDPNVAESYAETSDMVPEEWLDQIVILKISTAGLDPNKFGIDSNVQDNSGDTVEYHGVIPVSNISLYKQGVAESGTIDSLPRTPTTPENPWVVPVSDDEEIAKAKKFLLTHLVKDSGIYHALDRGFIQDPFYFELDGDVYSLSLKGDGIPKKVPTGLNYPGNPHGVEEGSEPDAYIEALKDKLSEKILQPNDPVEKYVDVFQKANYNQPGNYQFGKYNPQNRTPQKRERMAKAASYAAKTSKKK